jgi:tetratricopeptide (TPR) repeat protein
MLPQKKQWAFKIGAILLSVVFILLLEGLLRLAGYGTDYALFIQDEDRPDCLVMNPHVSEKYFFDQKNAVATSFQAFKKRKGAETLRIFILGASTGIGYPYRHNGAFQRWLQYSMNSTFPDTTFEIVNLSLTAVNTYTLLDFTKQLVSYEPDAVLIYTGHNEYYGALGVGSVNSMGRHPSMVRAMLWLRNFRLVQLITETFMELKSLGGLQEGKRETLMKKMAADQEIPCNSKLYGQGVDQFRTNLKSILSILDDRSVPTFISTLVSNEKDLSPFISDTADQKSSALYHYKLGQRKYATSDFSTAKDEFVRAKELDLLRFRAPVAMNDIIRKMATEHTNVLLVDTKARFEKESPHGILGKETLLEHVHPNIRGYSLLAHTFYISMKDQKLFDLPWQQTLSWEELRSQMPVTEVDSMEGAYELMALKEGWPFYEPIPKIDTAKLGVPETIAGQLAIKQLSWDEAMERLYQYYQKTGNDEQALKVAEGVTLEYPDRPRFYVKAAELAVRLKKTQKADYLYGRAFALDRSVERAKKITVNLIQIDAFEEALPYLEYIKEKDADNLQAVSLYGALKAILKMMENGDVSGENPDTSIRLAENYRLIGRRNKAVSALRAVLKQHPDNTRARELLEEID